MPLTALPAANFANTATGFAALQAHAKANGYAIYRYNKSSIREVFACDRARKYDSRGKNPSTHSSKQRQGTGSKKCGCPMRVALRLDRVSGSWGVEVLEAAHNHSPSAAATAHPAYRTAVIGPNIYTEIGKLACSGLLPRQVLAVLRVSNPAIPLTAKDISNITQ